MALDGRNGLRGTRRVSQWGLHGCSVTARDILRTALADAATALVLFHSSDMLGMNENGNGKPDLKIRVWAIQLHSNGVLGYSASLERDAA